MRPAPQVFDVAGCQQKDINYARVGAGRTLDCQLVLEETEACEGKNPPTRRVGAIEA